MRKMRAVGVVVALGCAAACLGQPASEPASAGEPAFVKSKPSKGGKVPKTPTCPAKFEDSLETNGVAPIGNVAGVTQPKPVSTPEPEFSDKARKEMRKRHISESGSVIAFVVDADGKPRDLCVQKSAEFDLDEEAARAVWQYRFEPATKDGKPVAKRLNVQIAFRFG